VQKKVLAQHAASRCAIAGAVVCGSFITFDPEHNNLGHLKASEAQLQPFLICFSRGRFARVKRLNQRPALMRALQRNK
jgi:hypothetical protein